MQSSFSILLACAFAAATVQAQSLSGTLVDSLGAPVSNAAVILSNGAPTGTTDLAGNFLITGLRNRTYTIQIDPHTNFLDAQQFDFAVNGAAALGTRVLQPAFPVSATFHGPTGAGLLGVNMNAYLLDGTKLFTPHDGSDALGNVVIGVPANVPVRIRGVPPVGSGLVPFEQIMTVTAPVGLGTLTMPAGFQVTGNVVDQNNFLPIAGCELVTTNMLTGEVVLQLNKLTNATGAFSLLVPFGLFQIDIIPPLGNLHVARQIFGLPAIFPRSLGLVKLQPGALLTGTVLGPSGPVAGADIDVYTAGNDKLFTPSDNTNAAGAFSVIVPAGPTTNYSVRVDPLVSNGLVGTRTAPFSFPASTNVGTISLAAGVPLNLTVLDAANNPVGAAHLRMTDPTTGAVIITPGDFADANGLMNAIVPTGTWNFSVAAPQGSLSAPMQFNNISIAGPLTTTVNLAPKVLMGNLEGLGILTVTPGGEIFIRFSFFNVSTQTVSASVEGFVQTPDGAMTPWVSPLILPFFPQFGMGIELWIPTPVMTPADYDRLLRFTVRIRDANTGAILDEAFMHFVISV